MPRVRPRGAWDVDEYEQRAPKSSSAGLKVGPGIVAAACCELTPGCLPRCPWSPADNFNFCSVPLSGADAFLFAALALLVASVCMGKLQSVWVLIVGAWGPRAGAGSLGAVQLSCALRSPARVLAASLCCLNIPARGANGAHAHANLFNSSPPSLKFSSCMVILRRPLVLNYEL